MPLHSGFKGSAELIKTWTCLLVRALTCRGIKKTGPVCLYVHTPLQRKPPSISAAAPDKGSMMRTLQAAVATGVVLQVGVRTHTHTWGEARVQRVEARVVSQCT